VKFDIPAGGVVCRAAGVVSGAAGLLGGAMPGKAAVIAPCTGPFTIDTDGDGVNDANLVTGMIDLFVIELATPAEMLRSGHPTVTSKGEWLESGGAFEARAFQGDKELTILKFRTVEFTKPGRVGANPAIMQWFVDAPAAAPGADPLWNIPVAQPINGCNSADRCKSDQACFDQPGCRPFLCVAPQACGFAACLGTQPPMPAAQSRRAKTASIAE
jgi:hypothetical protein